MRVSNEDELNDRRSMAHLTTCGILHLAEGRFSLPNQLKRYTDSLHFMKSSPTTELAITVTTHIMPYEI